jgi:UDP-glucose 4-epimerase
MNILITGAYGFLGRYVAKEFKKQGNDVSGIGHGKWDLEEYTKWGLDIWYESTITLDALLSINKKFDVIVHCGGSGSVALTHGNPYKDFQKSVQSTLALLEYIRIQASGCKFIYPSSPAVQGNLGDVQISEDMEAFPVSQYGSYKKIAEDICRSYHNNYGITVGIVRLFSIYGEGLRKQLLWDACKKIQHTDCSAKFFGSGKETRDWLHVSDAAKLIFNFSQTLSSYHVVNGGSGIKTKICDILELLQSHFNKPVKIEFNGEIKPGDPVNYWADNKRANALGWKPIITLDEGLKEYVNFFKSIHND